MAEQGPIKKRIVLVNRDFQLRYTKLAVTVGVASTLMTFVLILFPLYQFKILRFGSMLPTPFIIAMVLAALANIAVIAVIGILATHRIAGPMFSMVRQMRCVIDGKWSAFLKIRDTDDMRYLVRNFNELIWYLLQTAKGDLAKIEKLEEALGEALSEPSQEALIDLKTQLAQRICADQSVEGSKP
jgi:signal transduction histidine kinase